MNMPRKDRSEYNEYQKLWAKMQREKNRAEVQAYKVNQGCADCGYNAHHAGLEFDHVADDKYHNVASLMAHTKRLWQEIAKCEVVCGICHNIRTWDRMVEKGVAADYLSNKSVDVV